MNIKFWTLNLLLIVSSVEANTFTGYLGDYNIEAQEISDYYQENGFDYFQINRPNESIYKLNFRNQFEISQWYQKDWFSLQNQFSFDLDRFNQYYNGQTLNESKINYYSNLDFSKKKMFHEEERHFYKEWGGLNHPPIINKIKDLEAYHSHYQEIDYQNIESPFFETEFQEKVDALSSSELSFQNEINILEDHHSYDRKLELIKNAKEIIFMSSLVFICDDSTKILVNELIKKSNEGIPTFILVDKLISTVVLANECLNKMDKNGVHVMRANDFFKGKGSSVYHSKVLVVDNKVAITGGQNMIDADNKSNSVDFKNRDIDIEIKGPLVTDIAISFIDNYEHFYHKKLQSLYKRTLRQGIRDIQKRSYKRSYEKYKKHSISTYKIAIDKNKENESKNKLRGKSHYQEILRDPTRRMNGVCRFIMQSPYEDGVNIGKTYLEYLDQTESYLSIQTPEILDRIYATRSERPLIEKFDTFTMYNKLHKKIQTISKNIKIDLITAGPEIAGNENVVILHEQIKENLNNGKNRTANFNFKLINFWNNFYGKPHYENLLTDYAPNSNINVWNHISFIHSKIFYFDRIAASIGSYNLHHNATDHSYENTIICLDEKLNNQLDEVMVRDMANSVPLVYKDLK